MYIEINDKRMGYQRLYIEFKQEKKLSFFYVNVWDIQLLLNTEQNNCYPLAKSKALKVIGQ